jgi:tRNA(Ile)-lysidine synthase
VPSVNTDASEALLVAFSGGGDSRALLQRALETANGRRILAGVIDHGLRPGSAAEAERAADIARAAGADAQVLTLDWPQGQNQMQAAARGARLFALTHLARQNNIKTLLFGHTMDDQAETVLIRLSQGSGWRGLSAMAYESPAPLWPGGRGLRFRRPMLGLRREALRQDLRGRGLEWIDDPSNQADRFMRVRVRRRLEAWGNGPLGVERWAGLAARLAPVAAALDAGGRDLIAKAATFADGHILLLPEAYAAAPKDIRIHTIAAVLLAAAGAGGSPAYEQLDRLDGEIVSGAAKTGTLGGARFWEQGKSLVFGRDPGAVLGRAGVPAIEPEPLELNKPVVWDGRIELTATEVGWEAGGGPDGTSPLLLRPRTNGRLTIREAVSQGVVHAQWLLQERISHLLWR